MKKKLNLFVLMLLLIGQTILGPIAAVSASDIDVPPSNEVETDNDGEASDGVVEDDSNSEVTDDDSTTGEEVSDEETDSDSSEDGEGDEITEEAEENKLQLFSTGSLIDSTDFRFDSITMYDTKPEIDGGGHAIPVGNRIGDVNVRPGLSDSVAVIFEWRIIPDNHDYDDGSTYTFQLPDGFNITSTLDGDLTGGVGTYTVNTNGEVTFLFNEAIWKADLSGDFYVWISYDETYFGDGTNNEVDFTSLGGTEIEINFKNPINPSEMTKTGVAKKNGSGNLMNPDEIEWTVRFNQSEQEIASAVFKDTLGKGLTLKGNTVDVYELTVQPDGKIVVPSTPTTTNVSNVIVTDDKQSFEVNLGNTEKAYEIKYKTTVEAPTTAPFTNVSYTNSAEITGAGTDGITTKVGTATVDFSQPLTKSSNDSVGYDPETQITTWKVQYNYNERTISSNSAWIEDTFGAGFELVADPRVYNVTINSDGSGSRAGELGAGLFVKSDITEGFRIDFNGEIKTAYEIEYQLKPKSDRRVYGAETISNRVTMHGGVEAIGTKPINQVIFKKSVTGRDFTSKKTIDWQLTVNEDKKAMTDIVITDAYQGNHMWLDPTTVKINNIAITDTGSVFELGYLTGENDYEKGFVIKLKPGETLSTLATITYTTKFDPKEGRPSDGSYKNTATLDWKENNNDQKRITDDASEPWQPFTQENGNKQGKYNPSTKEFTWTIDVNYNNHNITNAILKDEWISNGTDAVSQTYVTGSLEVHKLIQNTGNNSVSEGALIESITEANLTINSPNANGFTLNIGDIGTEAIRIIYKTSLDGEDGSIVGSYSNKATLTDGENGPQRFSKSATAITPVHDGQYVYKSGKQRQGEMDIVDWSVTVNPSQSYIAAGAQLTDTLSENQILFRDTIKLYKTTLPTTNNDNNITRGDLVNPSDYKITGTGNEIIITFANAIKTSYILEYESFINDDDGEVIKNKVEFQGQSQNVTGGGSSEGLRVNLQGAGGGASSTGSGKIKIIKTGDSGELLEGVIFELYNASGTTLLETLVTDKDGVAQTTRNYRNNINTNGIQYQLKETSTIEGYIIAKDYVEKKNIFFKDSIVPFEIVNEKIRRGFEFTKVDTTDSAIVLPGAEFELRREDGTVVIPKLISNRDGKVSANNLEAGTYNLVETKAPIGYVVDSTPIAVTIVANQTVPTPVGTDGKVKNAKGTGAKIVVTKVNVDDNLEKLNGAEFELYGNENNKVGNTETTVNGKVEFTNLPYGEYTIKEVKSPEGYVDASLVADKVVLVDKAEVEVTFENEKLDLSVKLTKTQVNNPSKLLKGAEFKLMKEDPFGNYVEESTGHITDGNGEIYLADLEIGKYQFIETKAPSGYRLDATPVDFEITENQTETEEVEKENRRVSTPGPAPTCTEFTLTVKDAENNGRENVEVTLKNADGTVELTGTTNAAGEVVFAGPIIAGDYTVFEGEKDLGQVFVDLTKDNCQAEVTTPDDPAVCTEFTLTVKDAEGDVRENVEVTVKDASGEVVASGTTDADGNIAVPNTVPPGEYTVFEGETELGKVTVDFTEGNCQGEVGTPVNPAVCTEFTLTVKDEEGNVRENVEVTVKDATGNVVASGTTDAEGKITVPNTVPTGEYTVFEGETELGKVTVDFTEGNCEGEVGTPVNPAVCTEFTLTVKDAEGNVRENVEVTVKDTAGTVVALGTTNADGKITVPNTVPAGEYTVFEGETELGKVTVDFTDGNCQGEVTTPAEPAVCTDFTITVKDAEGNVRENVEVTVKDAAGTVVLEGTTDADGKITVPNTVPAGDYTVFEGETELGKVTVDFTEGKCQAVVGNPNEPVEPGPGEPGEENPGNPGNPGGENPGNPGNPGGENPGNPGNPGGENPGNPGNPGGGDPGNPGNPGGGNPGNPGNPGGGNPGNPGNPEKPVTPPVVKPEVPVTPPVVDPKVDPEKPEILPEVDGDGDTSVPPTTIDPNNPNSVGAGNEQGEGGNLGKDDTTTDSNASVHGSGDEKAEGGLLGKDGQPTSQVGNAGGEQATLPQTGEQNMLYMMIFGFALILMGGMMIGRRKTNE